MGSENPKAIIKIPYIINFINNTHAIFHYDSHNHFSEK